MIGIDTNVLVRFIAQDDPVQSPKAAAFVESLSKVNPGYVTVVTLAELAWVLRYHYDVPRHVLGDVVERLLNLPVVMIDCEQQVREALVAFRASTVDFSDQLIERCGSAAGCEETVTFDRKAARLTGMRLL
jgi:predicted nucleic-acid-binding protein